jgi:hypothetical protein
MISQENHAISGMSPLLSITDFIATIENQGICRGKRRSAIVQIGWNAQTRESERRVARAKRSHTALAVWHALEDFFGPLPSFAEEPIKRSIKP